MCTVCGKMLEGIQKKYCSLLCKSKNHYSNNRIAQKFRGKNRKKYFVNLLGGKCSKCGYSKCLDALCFHHLSDKKFTLDIANLRSKNLQILNKEVNKCILLCSNCHMEDHHHDLNIDDIIHDNNKQKQKSINRKIMLINKRGGKCYHCSYNKNLAALCFHHIDPSTKKIKLDFRSLANYSIEIIYDELEKFQLLCSNCHLEVHSKSEP